MMILKMLLIINNFGKQLNPFLLKKSKASSRITMKNQTNVKRWGTPQNFFLAFIDEPEKQIIIIKMLKWANKTQNNFNIYNVEFFLKKQK